MLSSKQQEQQESSGWKWEVNHDGVIWNWSPPIHSPVTYSPVTYSPVTYSPVKSIPQTQKKSLVDYWYTVHDGLAIPWSGEQ